MIGLVGANTGYMNRKAPQPMIIPTTNTIKNFQCGEKVFISFYLIRKNGVRSACLTLPGTSNFLKKLEARLDPRLHYNVCRNSDTFILASLGTFSKSVLISSINQSRISSGYKSNRDRSFISYQIGL